jgi:hypothetical protein
MTSPKDKYRALCRLEKGIPVFLKDWWLDAACGKENWDVVLHEEGGNTMGAMPFYKTGKAGFTVLKMPMLTSNWGPWIRPATDKRISSQLNYEHQVMSRLLEKLPRFDYFNQRFRNTLTNGLPFFWKGFSLQTRYTYIIDDLSNLDSVYENFNTNVKRQIKKAEKLVRVAETSDVEIFYGLNTKTFHRQKTKIPYSLSYVRRLDEACKQNNSRKIFIAVDDKEQVHASLYLVWDEMSAYYLMGGTDPAFSSGAFSLLMWEAIKTTSGVSQRFDFEGSMIESIELFFRSFGPRQVPYLQVQKINSPLIKVAQALGGSAH